MLFILQRNNHKSIPKVVVSEKKDKIKNLAIESCININVYISMSLVFTSYYMHVLQSDLLLISVQDISGLQDHEFCTFP